MSLLFFSGSLSEVTSILPWHSSTRKCHDLKPTNYLPNTQHFLACDISCLINSFCPEITIHNLIPKNRFS